MSLKEKMEKFNQRWSVTSQDSYEESFDKFKTRILNIFEDIDSHVTEESITAFCQYYGISEQWHSGMMDNRWSTNIIDRLRNETSEVELYRLVELIFSLDIRTTAGYHSGDVYSRRLLYAAVSEAINLSNVNVAITAKDGDIILYPRGEEELDEKLVNETLSFLNPESSTHYEQALKFYQSNNPIKSAESLRRAIEEFLRFKLSNTKGLDANIINLQKKLKESNNDIQVRNIVSATFRYLDTYFNENSKHHDGEITEPENEFLIYQTGLLLRYLNRTIV